MKGTFLTAAAAALAGTASAGHMHRRAHELFQARGHNATDAVCTPGCTTIYTTIYGEPTWCPDAPIKPTPTPVVTPPPTVPTPIVNTCPTPGTYTFPETTVVVTETTTVCAASTTKVPSGTHTLGGVTTVVTTSTVVTCPYATTETASGGVVTSVIKTTTYVCPSAGTYTIAPITETVTVEETVVVVPVVTTYCPGTYTAPAVVTTVTETDVVVVCPFTSPAPVPTYTPSPVASSPVKPTESTKPPKLGGGGGLWAMTYTPYDEQTGACKGAAQVMEDVAELKAKGFKSLRVYSTDCDTLPNVGAACKAHGIKMITGVFINQPGCDNSNPDVAHQIASIKDFASSNPELVEMCVVGNEAGHNGYCSAGQLAGLITQVKTVLVSVGCNAPVTTTDTVATWQMSGWAEAICPVVDVVACNAHAYFNAGTSAGDAGPFVKGQLEIVKALCGGKEGYIMETGWPNSCVANGAATCNAGDQAAAISSLKEAVGDVSVFFSWKNDHWKQPGSCNCEDKWGCGDLF